MDIKRACKNCADKHLNCHSECSKYAKYKEQLSELKEAMRRSPRTLPSACTSHKKYNSTKA